MDPGANLDGSTLAIRACNWQTPRVPVPGITSGHPEWLNGGHDGGSVKKFNCTWECLVKMGTPVRTRNRTGGLKGKK